MLAEQVTDALAHHGEGPVWDARHGTLYWLDMLRGDVLSLDGRRRHLGEVAACIAPRRDGGFVVAIERSFLLVDDDWQPAPIEPVVVWDDPSVRMNEGACDPSGRFWCGSMDFDARPNRGALYCLDTDLTVRRVFDDITISNGLEWTADGTRAYYIDSPTQRVDVCPPDLSSREPFVEIPTEAGLPDGLALDAEGGVWVALWGGSAVHRYGPDGRLDAVVELPVRQPTSCAFGGPDLDTLYITTSAQDLADPEPAAGALFAVRPGVRGLPVREFAR